MDIKTTTGCIGLLVAVFAASSALAADSGFYVGAGAGQATFKDDAPAIGDIDESDMAWKGFVGYRFGGFIPILDLAGELTWRDFGKPDGINFKYDASGYDASALGIFTLGPIDLFARIGIGQYDLEETISGTSTDHDGSGTLYGVGAGLRIWKVNVRAEWERVEADGVDNIDMYTLNAYFQF